MLLACGKKPTCMQVRETATLLRAMAAGFVQIQMIFVQITQSLQLVKPSPTSYPHLPTSSQPLTPHIYLLKDLLVKHKY